MRSGRHLDDVMGRVLAWCREHARTLTIAVIALGVLSRLVQYLWKISYWGDEAFLVLNVREKSGMELAGALDAVTNIPQSAPPAFLWLTKWIVQSTADSEYAYRSVPLVCSILAVLLFAWVARRFLSVGPALLATTMLALSWSLLRHAGEFKQYSGDAFVSIVLIAIGLCSLKERWWLRLGILSLTTAIGVWFSETSAMVYAGVACAMLFEGRLGLRRSAGWAILCAIPAASFVALYVLSIQEQQASELYEYWAGHMLAPGEWWSWPWFVIGRLRHVANYACEPLGPAILLCAGIAATELWRSGRRSLCVGMIVPVALTLLACTLGVYPVGGRVTTFLTPVFILLAAHGFGVLDAWLQRAPNWRGVCRLVPSAVVVLAVAPAAYRLFSPRILQHVRPAAEFVYEHWNRRDPIYLVGGGYHPFVVYWPESLRQVRGESENLKEAPPEQNFWLVYSYSSDHGPERRGRSVQVCQSVADAEMEYRGVGGRAIYFQRRADENESVSAVARTVTAGGIAADVPAR